MERIPFVDRSELERLRGDRGFAWQGPGLWARGSLDGLAKPCVAIVGTRAASTYGKRLARSFARDLALSGICVISGLALGIDAAAHEGALDANACTVGVLGSGHACFFPRRNQSLAERMIAQSGAVLSPYPPEHPAFPHQFLERNSVVAALADAVVVIEAPMRSGALNTAHWAADRIPVFAVPGDVDRSHVQGCHALIRDGAILARNASDVLEALHFSISPARRIAEREGLAGALLRALANGETSVESLTGVTAATTHDVLAAIAMLELEGVVEARGGARYGLVQP